MTNDLKKSMSEREVIAIMGNSEEKRSYYDKNILVYYIHSSIFELIFTKTPPYIGFFPLNRTGKEFWVILENDKVTAFGYSKNFGDRFFGIAN
jgi:hypothetical protein